MPFSGVPHPEAPHFVAATFCGATNCCLVWILQDASIVPGVSARILQDASVVPSALA